MSYNAPRMEKPVVHSMKRRCFCHDYSGRGIYMITLEVEGRRPLLGRLVGERIAPTPLGEAVADCWRQIPRFHPDVQPLECAVMPDHFHGLLFVRRPMARHLGVVVRGFKAGCTQRYRAIYGATPDRPAHIPRTILPQESAEMPPLECGEMPMGCAPATLPQTSTGIPPSHYPLKSAGTVAEGRGSRPGAPPYMAAMAASLFAPGYHDRILTHHGQLETLFRYIRDNPNRLAARRAHPDYFTRINALPIAGTAYAAYGNPFLLNRPDRLQIQCSRRIAPDALAAEQARLLDAAERGAVLVSPCISPGEKQIARAALDAGLPLVALKADGFAPRYKPPGRYFDACAAGLLLLLAPHAHGPSNGGGAHMPRASITRAQCLALNRLAADICGPGAAACSYAGLVPIEYAQSQG